MFLTATEVRNVRVTLASICEAYELSVAVARPYLVRALRDSWTVLVWATATAYALGLVARDLWEWGRPRYCQLVDEFVQSCLTEESGDGCRNDQDNGADGDIDQTGTDRIKDGAARAEAGSAGLVDTAIQPATNSQSKSTRRRTLVELRKSALSAGVKGAGRMSSRQLAALGYTQ